MHPLFNLAFMTFAGGLIFALGILAWFLKRPSNREVADKVIFGRGPLADGAGSEIFGTIALGALVMGLLAWGVHASP